MAEEKQVNKFISSDKEYDRDKLLDVIAKNADAYAQYRLQMLPGKRNLFGKLTAEAFDVNGFLSALSDVKSAISEGKLSRTAGDVYVNTDGTTWTDPLHRAALDLVNKSIAAIDTIPAKEKTKYSNTRINDRFKNKFYGGNFSGSESDFEMWKNKSRGIQDIAEMIDDEISDLQNNDELDYTGAPFKNREEHLAKLSKLSLNLKDGKVDGTDYADWVSIGGDSALFRYITGYTEPEKSQEEKNKEKREAWIKDKLENDPSYTYDEAASEYDNMIKKSKLEREKKAYNDAENDEWVKYANSHFKKGQSKVIASLGTSTLDSKIWNGNKGLDEDDVIPAWLSNATNQRYAANLYDKLKSGQLFNFNGRGINGLTDAQILRWLLYDLKNKHPEAITKAEGNKFYINDTFNIEDGTVLLYDPDTRLLTKRYISEGNKIAKAKLKSMWKNKYYNKYSTSSSSSWLKHGGHLEKLLLLRNGSKIRKALSGAELVSGLAADKTVAMENNYNKAVSKEAIEKYGSDSTKNRNRVKIGHEAALSTEADHKAKGIEGLDNSDYIRLATLAADLTSIGASYIPVYGNAVAGILGIGSTVGDLIADATDDTVSSGLMLTNLGTNAGLTALSLIPGGGTGKVAKVIRSAKTLVPLITTAIAGTSLATDKEFLSALKKLTSDKKLTTNDFKQLAMGIKILAGGHNAGKAAAGKIAPKLTNYKGFGKSVVNTVGEGAGRWGYNAFGEKGIYAKDTAVWNAVKEAGGLKSIPYASIKKGEKYSIPTKEGNVEVKAETYKAMNDAYNKAIKEKFDNDGVLNKVKEAYIKSEKLNKTTKTKSSGQLDFEDTKAIEAFFKTTPEPDANGNFKVKIKGADDLTVRDIDLATYETFKKAYQDAGNDANAKLAALNAAYKNKFADQTIEIDPETPDFDLGSFRTYKDSNWYNPLSWLRYTNHNLDATDLGESNWINPQGDLFANSTEGLANQKLLGEINRIYGNPKGFLANNFEYINGLTSFKKNDTQRLRNLESLKKIQEDAIIELLNAKWFAELKAGSTLPEFIESLKKSNKEKYKADIRAVKKLLPEFSTKDDKEIERTLSVLLKNLKLTNEQLATIDPNYKVGPLSSLANLIKLGLNDPDSEFYGKGVFDIMRTFRTHSGNGPTPKTVKIQKSPFTVGKINLGSQKINTYKVNTTDRGSINLNLLKLLRNKYGIDLNLKSNLPAPSVYNLELLLGLSVNRLYNTPMGIIWWKEGGKFNLIKDLRESNFILDNLISSELLSKFKQGGILKAASGIKFANGTGEGWQTAIFDVYADDLINKLINGKLSADVINGMLDKHSLMYNDALKSGNWLDNAFTYDNNDNIKTYQLAYDNADQFGYNRSTYGAIQKAAQAGRYIYNNKATSGDNLNGKFVVDNLYSAETDDRRVLGRAGDWGEVGKENDAYKKYQEKFKKAGYEMYYDPNTKYYKLKRLGDSTPTNTSTNTTGTATTPTDSTNSTNINGSTADPGTPLTTTDKIKLPSLSTVNNILKSISPDLIEFARLLRNLRNNRYLNELAKKKEVAYLSPILKHRNVYGDFAALEAGERQAGSLMSTALRAAEATNNVELGLALLLESLLKANDAIEQARLKDNAAIKESMEKAWQLQNEVYDYNHKVADENNARTVSKINADIDADMGLASANTTNKNTWSMGVENRLRSDLAEAKSRALQLAQFDLELWWQDNVTDTANIQNMKLQYSAITGSTEADIKKRNELLANIQKEQINNKKKYQSIREDWLRHYYSGDFAYRPDSSVVTPTFTIDNTTGNGFVATAKNGTKIDSSKMKYKADDLRELRKLIKHTIDTNLKALDNLSKATLLELKKMMGI